MNFDLTEEQALLKASVERFCVERYGGDLEKRRRYRADPTGFDRAGWTQLARLGLTALPFTEADGGLGGGPVDLVAVAEPLGRALATEPFTECLVAGGALIAAAGTVAQREAMLPGIISGDILPTLAILETAGRYNLAHVETRARRTADGWVLSGAKTAVWQGLAADVFLVSARVEGDIRDALGIALFAVPANSRNVDCRPWRATDGQVAVELALRDAMVGESARLGGAGSLRSLESAVQQSWLAASAEMLGAATLLFDATLAYVKTRSQFGRTLGSFQVVQHRLTDCYVALEQARSMVYRAALAPGPERARSIAGTKAFVSDAARKVSHEAVQFHGGMGVTDELVVGHGLKRIQFLSRLWGDPDTAAMIWSKAA